MATKSQKIKVRLDVLVVDRGFAATREKAQALILAGQVLSGDRLLDKPGLKVDETIELRIRGEVNPYVSRGAYKLKGALEHFGIDLSGRVCLDVGASTGGFTQVCLERGAVKVYAVDVGHNQLDWKIRSDERVVSMDGVNMRTAQESLLPEKVTFCCIDTSFISLKLILPPVKQFLLPGADVVALVKPQFEVGKDQVGKGGIVRDPALHDMVLLEITAYAQSIGFQVLGLIESSIRGTEGNKEFLLHLR